MPILRKNRTNKQPYSNSTTIQGSYILSVILCLVIAFLSACTKHPEGPGKAVSWSKLKGWHKDKHAEIWPALMQSCKALAHKRDDWKSICAQAKQMSDPSDKQARLFFEKHFVPHRIYNEQGKRTGIFTGYFVPTLEGSTKPDKQYRYPIYRRPADMITVKLSSLYPKLKGMRLRGRLKGRTLVPYFSREQIDNKTAPLKGHEIVWVKDKIALFFMHIQGSGYIKLPDGKIITVGYADQNGHPYIPVGRILIKQGDIPRELISLQSIRKWMLNNPARQQELMNHNPSYVFFRVIPAPLGALGVPLTSGRSVAVDRSKISLGLPVWIETTYPDVKVEQTATDALTKTHKGHLRRLFMAQDVGGAIKGAVRADIFWGQGELAKLLAGHMNQKGKMYILKPRTSNNK